MRAEKQFIAKEYVDRLEGLPYFIVVDYQGLTVPHFIELRRRLGRATAEIHVIKNSVFQIAAKQFGAGELGGLMSGQLAVISGTGEISSAAKVAKTFQAEFEKPKLRFAYLDGRLVDLGELTELADLPSMDVLRSMLLNTLGGPATQFVRLLNTPASQLAQVLRARNEERQPAAES